MCSIHDSKYHYLTGTHCWFCDREFGVDKVAQLAQEIILYRTKEHIISKWRGGINDVRNYIASCSDCNQMKGASNAKGFARKIEELMTNATHPMFSYFNLMRTRAWKIYNKTSKAHKIAAKIYREKMRELDKLKREK